MALINPTLGEMRGSVAGNTFSRNKGGTYVRLRGTPTNPNSTRQQVVRSILADLSQYWSSDLSAQEREDWGTWAQEHPVLNKLGQSIYLSGLDWFIKINSRLVDSATAILDEPPIGAGPGSLATLTVAFASATTLTVTFTPTPCPAGTRVQLFCSLPLGVGTQPNFRQMRLVGYSAAAAASPVVMTLPFSFQIGNRIVCYATLIDAEGQIAGYLRAEATRAA